MYITQMKASFHANVYGNGCNALRERLQCFTGTVANVCRNGCNALRLRWAKAGTEIVSPIMYKRKWGRKGRKVHYLEYWFSQGI